MSYSPLSLVSDHSLSGTGTLLETLSSQVAMTFLLKYDTIETVPIHIVQLWELVVSAISSIGLRHFLFIVLLILLFIALIKRGYYNVRQPKRILTLSVFALVMSIVSYVVLMYLFVWSFT